MEKQEKILCAAIWYKEILLKNPELLNLKGRRPTNTDKGVVVSGYRHNNCIVQICAITGLKNFEMGESIQGFLTNLNRFVDRIEGLEIAKGAKQIISSNIGTRLFSEDLY